MTVWEEKGKIFLKKCEVPIWEKVYMTIEEAAVYSNIGINKIDELAKNRCAHLLFI